MARSTVVVPETARVRRERAPVGRIEFSTPDLPAFTVRRERLLALLDLAAHQRLLAVVAPPGYGKTSLLAQWADDQRARRVRWVTLTAEHNDPARLALDLCGALEGPDQPFTDRLLPRLETGGQHLGRAFLAALIDEIAELPPTTL